MVSRDGTFSLNPAKIKDGIAALTRELMILEAEGSYTKAKDLIVKLGIVRPEVNACWVSSPVYPWTSNRSS